MRKSRKILKITNVLIAVFLIIGFFFLMNYLKSIEEYKSQVSAISFMNVDIGGVHDGTYTGESDVDILYAKVEIFVQRGEIINVNLLEHRNGRGLTAEEIAGKIVTAQTAGVDAVTSATNSSTVIKKAVEKVLMSGVQCGEGQKNGK